MRNYTAESYKSLVEDIQDETLQRFMQDEASFIAGIPDIKERTAVDLGAGYGRVLPILGQVANNVVAIEINPGMYSELERKAAGFDNVRAIQGDFLQLDEILPANVQRPLFLILQNSLGTIEGGDYTDVIRVVRDTAEQRSGELVLSLFRQPALKGWGVTMYGKLRDMVGAVDMDKSDFDEGIMVTDTGYTSKWWTDADIEAFRQLGQVVQEQICDEYVILRITFK